MLGSVVKIASRAMQVEARAARRAEHDSEAVYRSLRQRLRELHGPALRQARVLDFGCGYHYPLLVMLSRDVGEITGLEVSPVYRDGWREAVRFEAGARKIGGTVEAVLGYLESGRYYRHLEQRLRTRVDHRGYRIVRYPGDRFPFDDASFDCVISNAVLQELPADLGPFAREMARVLRPGGTIDLEWHSFYSLTGNYLGDHASRRNPWGHLLGGAYHPSLNRLTPDQVRAAFEPHFGEIRLLRHDRAGRIAGRDPDFEPEGEDLLTPELAARLADYPREWLLTRGYVLQGRRAPAG